MKRNSVPLFGGLCSGLGSARPRSHLERGFEVALLADPSPGPVVPSIRRVGSAYVIARLSCVPPDKCNQGRRLHLINWVTRNVFVQVRIDSHLIEAEVFQLVLEGL